MMQRPALLFTALLATALLILLPLRLALAGLGLHTAGLSARAVTGSVWSGHMDAARLRGATLGDIRVRLAPLALLSGTIRLTIANDQLKAALLRSPSGGGIADASGRLALDGLAGLPITALDLESVDIRFSNGTCQSASGRITALTSGLLAATGPLSGTPRCDGRQLLLPLAAPSGTARLDLHLAADAGYHAELALTAIDEAARPGLLAAGFQPTPQGVALRVQGSL